MSAFKELPNRKRVQAWRTVAIIATIISALTLAYLQKHHPDIAIAAVLVLFAILFGSIFYLMWVQHAGRCPECKQSLREIYEDTHPKAKDYHLFYCDRCDVIWDTTVPKSSD